MTSPARFRLRGARNSHVFSIAAAAAVLGLGAEAAQAATTAEVEAFTLSPSSAGRVISDSNASGKQALNFATNAGASRQLSLPEGISRIVVRARGQRCSGSPSMALDIDGKRVKTTTVGSSSYADYGIDVARSAGTRTLKVSFLNDYYRRSRCDRNLIVDKLTVVGNGTTAPAPAPAPEPAPAPTTSSPAPSTATVSGCPSGSRTMTGGNIATEVANTPSGGTLCLNGGSYSVASTIPVSKPMTIVGVNSPQLSQSFTGWFFRVSASGVTVQGLRMRGANRNRTGESCGGTGAITVGTVTNVKVLSNVVDSFTCGIQLNGTSSFSVAGNKLSAIKYAGITTFPAANGTIDGNTVTDVNTDGPLGQNAYGIAVSGNTSRNVVVSNNTVNRAPTWECFDTHDGQSIDFLNNTCIGPGRAGINSINAGIADPSGRIEGNRVNAGGLSSAWNSVAFGGTGTVRNNTIEGFGGCRIWAPKASISGNTCS